MMLDASKRRLAHNKEKKKRKEACLNLYSASRAQYLLKRQERIKTANVRWRPPNRSDTKDVHVACRAQ